MLPSGPRNLHDRSLVMGSVGCCRAVQAFMDPGRSAGGRRRMHKGHPDHKAYAACGSVRKLPVKPSAAHGIEE